MSAACESPGVFCWGHLRGADVVALRLSDDGDAAPVAGGFAFAAVLTRGELRLTGGRGYVADDVAMPGVRAAACGWEHALCATEADDRCLGWGLNAHGQSAPGNALPEVRAPLAFAALRVRSLAAGEQHSLALVADGAVFAWGAGSCGQLGHGGRADGAAPRRVEGLPGGVVAIAAGARHSLAAHVGGAYAWGWGLYGQCGTGSNEDVLSPQLVPALAGMPCAGVAAGVSHSVFLTCSGDCYAAGSNADGQLGLEEPADDDATSATERVEVVLTPQLLEAACLERGVVRVACGARHTALLLADGALATCGWNGHGQLCGSPGDDGAAQRRAPSLVPLPRAARDVQCGWWHTLVALQ